MLIRGEWQRDSICCSPPTNREQLYCTHRVLLLLGKPSLALTVGVVVGLLLIVRVRVGVTDLDAVGV